MKKNEALGRRDLIKFLTRPTPSISCFQLRGTDLRAGADGCCDLMTWGGEVKWYNRKWCKWVLKQAERKDVNTITMTSSVSFQGRYSQCNFFLRLTSFILKSKRWEWLKNCFLCQPLGVQLVKRLESERHIQGLAQWCDACFFCPTEFLSKKKNSLHI